MIKIKHITYNWERNACDEMLTDSGRVDSDQINLNSLIDRFGNMFLTHCYKTVLYVQLSESDWEIIIPFNEETLNAFIFQHRDKYISIYQQTSHFYVHEKKCFNVIKLDTEAMIDEMTEEVKNKLSMKHKLSYGSSVGGKCISNAFGTTSTKASTTASSNKFGKVVTKVSENTTTNKFAKVPTKAKAVDSVKANENKFAKVPTVAKTVAPAKASTKPKINDQSKHSIGDRMPRTQHFAEVPTNAPTNDSLKIKTDVSSSIPSNEKIVWEIQEDWD